MKKRFPRRPPRLPTVFQNVRPFFFITLNTYQRRPILANPSLLRVWLQFAQSATDRGVAVGRYVLMPDHVHLFAWFAPEMDMAQWVGTMKRVLGKELQRQGTDGPYWQEGFFDHLMRSDESYGEKWEYVRQNPVRKGLCDTPEDWPYQGEVMQLDW
jgi:REP element-mobilizing transposase RayT